MKKLDIGRSINLEIIQLKFKKKKEKAMVNQTDPVH